MQIYIRRAGFWNSKDRQLSSQFGHIMIKIGDLFYSFTQNKFLEGSKDGVDTSNCVQIIKESEFFKIYSGQVWNVIDLKSDDKFRDSVVKYFNDNASKHIYSLKNNCTFECQSALEAAGLAFKKKHIFPGFVLAELKSHNFANTVKTVKKIII